MSNAHELFSKFGQSIWLEGFDLNLLDNGGLEILVLDGVRGVSSNPDMYLKTITDTIIYDNAIEDFCQVDNTVDGNTLYQWLMTRDARQAADILNPVYSGCDGQDGFVNVELPAQVAYEVCDTIDAARHLWKRIDRKNLMIKIPATQQGVLAFETLIAENINVNMTHMFSLDDYKSVLQAYLRGLAQNPDPGKVCSVASYCVGVLDAEVNHQLDELGIAEVQILKNKAAVSSAKMAYQYFNQISKSSEFRALQNRGAHRQRLLWASDSHRTAEPDDKKAYYLQQLIGTDTVAALTPEAVDEFLLSGQLLHSLTSDMESALRIPQVLDSLEINLTAIAPQLREKCVRQLEDTHREIIKALEKKRSMHTKEYATTHGVI
jgi:transaldolase